MVRQHQHVHGFWMAWAVSATLLSLAQPEAAPRPTGWNHSPDPNAPYGLCLPGSIGSGMRSKPDMVVETGETLTDVLAITVLNCSPFSGGGGVVKVPCPAGSPYAYCVRSDNDGVGNDITLGVLEIDAITDPNGLYTGCPAGAQPQTKIGLVRRARDPRRIKGIVTLTCGAATQPTSTRPTDVDCPSQPHPYAYCLGTPNDGFGHAVTVGVVGAQGAGDPYGLYGECNTTLDAYGIQPGFHFKASLVQAVGRSLAHVRSIDLLTCNAPVGFGSWFPSDLQVGLCSEVPGFAPSLSGRYDYCIWGTDAQGNGLVAGVNKH